MVSAYGEGSETFVSRRNPAAVGEPATGELSIKLLPQVAIVAVAVAAYFLVRGVTDAAFSAALHNSRRVVALQRALGLYHEPAIQDALVTSEAVSRFWNTIYIYGHWPVIVATLIWLARRHPALYFRTRDSMIVSGSIGLVVFALFPVAPPRLADLGMTDTVSAASEAYRAMQPTIFTNQYAAMPSLHVGWNLLIALAIGTALRTAYARLAATAMAVSMAAAVVLTANHYVIDAVVGATLTTTCWFLVGRWHARRARRAAAGSRAS